ncbi:CPBP family intramembrane glutamic endopeptidase [Suipraeoptans intestinalis]|uniref:CPBP family intramembrane glutamic endopeptidase n=1 Tax=Suipraeoptans intestinalis TaxID=2606628 RepID=UPI0023F32DF1|nr:type II CAAX endopeptidase family protein [Suipraeoptans intestinalis]MDD7769351.1 type II CAAX endopeptidase family protein [Suipraeoptans intestinalis]MDY3121950.1 type II CAAX endopeptidase family protein [Suipraeoptans intestinalis]
MDSFTKQTTWRPWKAFLLEGIVVGLLFTAGGYMQARWGMTGLVLTELMFLALAIAVACLHRTPLKEVFPIKVPKPRECIGIFILAPAGLMCSMIAIGAALVLFPGAMDEVEGLSSFLYSKQSLLSIVLIAAILPAVCEEAIQRGAILSHLRSMKKDGTIILIMGVFFGVFHLSVARFLSTALLGGLLTWLVVKKNNLTLSMLLHFLNNLISVTIGFFAGKGGEVGAGAAQTVSSLRILGSYCILGCLMPVLLVWGTGLIEPRYKGKKRWLIAIGCSVGLLLAGILLV